MKAGARSSPVPMISVSGPLSFRGGSSARRQRPKKAMCVVVPVAGDTDAVGEGIEVGEVVRGQRHGGGFCVLPYAFDAPGARDRDDPRLLGEQPRQRDL